MDLIKGLGIIILVILAFTLTVGVLVWLITAHLIVQIFLIIMGLILLAWISERSLFLSCIIIFLLVFAAAVALHIVAHYG